MRVAFLVSGNGSTFEYLAAQMQSGFIPAVPVLVISSNSKAGALERAKRLGIKSAVIREKDFADAKVYEDALLSALRDAKAEFICLAGFLKLIPPSLIRAFPDRIINIHPALLPAFGGKGMYGMHVHTAVIKSGARISGATVHAVDNEYDHGKIISQRAVFVSPQDTPESLAARVHEAELQLYSQTLKSIAEGKIKIQNGMISHMFGHGA